MTCSDSSPDGAEDLDWLLTPAAVRGRAEVVLAAGLRGELPHFHVDLDRLADAVVLVREVTEAAYPDGHVPFHSRWRHFETPAGDLWVPLAAKTAHGMDRLRTRIDLAVISVLLDAGAGADWRYRDAETGVEFSRSEGLAVASIRLFQSGAFSQAPDKDPLRVDAKPLTDLTEDHLAAGLQVGSENPLVGLAARAELLRNLGRRMMSTDAFSHADGSHRVGNLFAGWTVGEVVPAACILTTLLQALNPIWPDGLVIGGRAMGDVGRHPLAGLVPFHKLSQWLAYSLIEPLEEFGVDITDADGLTGLPEYRNGGLLLDTGVLRLVDPAQVNLVHRDDSELVIEWRALTVALLDRLAASLREQLGETAESLPLGRVLQGGTWAAGRKLAQARSPSGDPSLKIATTGTRF